MSSNLLHRLFPLFRESNIRIPNTVEIMISGTIFTTHGIYAYGTYQNKNINILQKYSFVKNGFTQFMVIDENGKHYNMINSIWYWKWNSIEDWNSLDKCENKSKKVKIYGYRIPLLGIFPNIVSIN